MNYNIALISGDGIGPEIVAEAKKVLDKVCEVYGHTFSYKEVLLGGASIDAHGVPLTEEAIADAKASDAVLMGSIGGDAKLPMVQIRAIQTSGGRSFSNQKSPEFICKLKTGLSVQ